MISRLPYIYKQYSKIDDTSKSGLITYEINYIAICVPISSNDNVINEFNFNHISTRNNNHVVLKENGCAGKQTRHPAL